MSASLRAFTEGLIDYAGLFPPAKLPMADAVEKYLAHRTAAEARMLSRFICPASRLDELHEAAAANTGEPISISALGRGGANGTEFVTNLKEDVATIAEFTSKHTGRYYIDAMEVRVPDDLMTQNETRDVREIIQSLTSILEGNFPNPVRPFLELGPRDNWEDSLSYLVRFIDYQNNILRKSAIHPKVNPAGFKLRCGGVTADAFPSIEKVATTIRICRNEKTAMKLTAGLHHPVRHYNESVQTKMHGFINVVGAILFAWAEGLDDEALIPILAEEDASAFKFDDDGFTWRDRKLTLAQIESGRRSAIVSYGSCSFDEPVEDLTNLGLLSTSKH